MLQWYLFTILGSLIVKILVHRSSSASLQGFLTMSTSGPAGIDVVLICQGPGIHTLISILCESTRNKSELHTQSNSIRSPLPNALNVTVWLAVWIPLFLEPQRSTSYSLCLDISWFRHVYQSTNGRRTAVQMIGRCERQGSVCRPVRPVSVYREFICCNKRKLNARTLGFHTSCNPWINAITWKIPCYFMSFHAGAETPSGVYGMAEAMGLCIIVSEISSSIYVGERDWGR